MRQIKAILEIIASISSKLDLTEILAEVTEKTARLVGADSCAISRWNRTDNSLVVLADYIAPEARLPAGEDVDDLGQTYLLADFPLTVRVLRQQTPLTVYLDDPLVDEAEKKLLKSFQWAGALLLPMVYQAQTIGLMELYTGDRQRYQFTEEIITLGQILANQAAIAIEHARLFAELEAQRQTLRHVSRQLVKTQEEERHRLSRELHDEIGQTLVALKMNLDIAGQTTPANVPPKLRHSLAEAAILANQIQETVRILSMELRPTILDDLGLIPALRWELDRHKRYTGQQVQFTADLAGVELPPELEITIYRIAREALTNIIRHAQANQIRVRLQANPQLLEVTIEDDGVGFDSIDRYYSSDEAQHLGLISMRERAQLLDGQLRVISKIGLGTQIKAEFPLTTSRIEV